MDRREQFVTPGGHHAARLETRREVREEVEQQQVAQKQAERMAERRAAYGDALMPPPAPKWLVALLGSLQVQYRHDNFVAVMEKAEWCEVSRR